MNTNHYDAAKAATYRKPVIGCYFDGTFGQTYNDLRLLNLAIGYGWKDTETEDIAAKSEDDLTEDDRELLPDCAQDAESYLNSLETRPFLSWGWHDGDFGLYPDVDSAMEDCEFVSSKAQDYPDPDYRGEWLHVSDHGNVTLYVRGEDGKDTEVWSLV